MLSICLSFFFVSEYVIRFKLKYHPEDSLRRKQEQLDFLKVISFNGQKTHFLSFVSTRSTHLWSIHYQSNFNSHSTSIWNEIEFQCHFQQRRTEVFSDVLAAGLVTAVNVDTNQSDKLLRLLDTVVIKLEGGTDEDLKVLDEKPNIESRPEPIKETPTVAALATAKTTTPLPAEAKADANETHDDDNGEVKEDDANASNDAIAVEKPAAVEEKPSKKRKRTTSGSSSSSSSSTSSSGKSK